MEVVSTAHHQSRGPPHDPPCLSGFEQAAASRANGQEARRPRVALFSDNPPVMEVEAYIASGVAVLVGCLYIGT